MTLCHEFWGHGRRCKSSWLASRIQESNSHAGYLGYLKRIWDLSGSSMQQHAAACLQHIFFTHTCSVYIHSYIGTYLHTCMHTCMHTYMHACIHACLHAYTHTYIHLGKLKPPHCNLTGTMVYKETIPNGFNSGYWNIVIYIHTYIHTYIFPVVCARGGVEVALGLYYKTFFNL